MKRSLKFAWIQGSFAVCRLASGLTTPAWALGGSFFSITSTADELSIVCGAEQVPAGVQHEGGWQCFKLIGPFPFGETGILKSFIQPLSDNAVPIFAISTFDTDYVLVKDEYVGHALNMLQVAGHQLT
jgi:uncharacterized protein